MRALAQAEALERAGRTSDAAAVYGALLQHFPAHPGLLNSLALLMKGQGKLVEAEALFRSAIAAAPGDAALHNNIANLLRRAVRLAEAEEHHRKALALKPNYPEAAYNYGLTLEEMGRADAALAAHAQAVQLRPGYAQALTRIGAIRMQQDRSEDALGALDRAVAAEPSSFDANYYRGWVLARLERFDEALLGLGRAAAIAPERIEALLAIANTLRDAQRYDEALAAYWKIVERQPAHVDTHIEIAKLTHVQGRADVLKSFEYARTRLGDQPDLLLAEARLRFRRDELAEAEGLLRRAAILAPGRGDIAGFLGTVLANRRKFDEAAAFFRTAIAAEPDSAFHRHQFGFALLSAGAAPDALSQFEAALVRGPFDQLALGGLALALRQEHDGRYGDLVDFGRYVRTYEIETPAGYGDLGSFNLALAGELNRLHTSKVEPLEQTLRGGTQTIGRLFAQPAGPIGGVRRSIDAAIVDYIKSVPDDAAHPLSARKSDGFSYAGSWSCRLRSAGFHTNHVHPQGWISSAYYASLPGVVADEAGKQGWFKLGESNLALGERDCPERLIKPEVGLLVLFPSFYWHGTVPFTAPEDRLTVAFDVVPGRA